jgi:hypothetical protein
MPHMAESIFLLDNAKLKMLSPMTDFLKVCYFDGFCKGRKNFVPIHRYAKKLRAMPHSAELKKKCYLRLCAIPINVKFKSKIFLSTPRYAA